MTRDRRCKIIVHLARDRDALRSRHEVRPRTGIRQHLHAAAGLIHRLQAPLADLGRQLEWTGAAVLWRCPRPEAAPADGGPIDTPDQSRHREMLLQRNNPHGILACVDLYWV